VKLKFFTLIRHFQSFASYFLARVSQQPRWPFRASLRQMSDVLARWLLPDDWKLTYDLRRQLDTMAQASAITYYKDWQEGALFVVNDSR
jgi:hypothetical protein